MAARKKGGFNLAKLDTIAACNKPVEVNINDVNGKPTSVFVSIVGRDSDAVRGRVRDFADQEMQAEAVGQSSAVDSGERRTVEMLVAATTGWRDGDDPALQWGDERLEFTPDNARKVFTGIIPIRDQLSVAIFNLSLFMKG